MRTIVRSIAVMAVTAGLVGACGTAAAPTPTSTPAPTPAPTQAAPAATAAPSGPVWAPIATLLPLASVGPKDAAYVTCTATITGQPGGGKETTKGDLSYIEGEVMVASNTCSDARVVGTTTVTLNGVATADGIGFEWGTVRLVNDGGTWEGTFSGAIWAGLNASDLSFWFTGTGAYAGLTYNAHGRSAGYGSGTEGVILAAPMPSSVP